MKSREKTEILLASALRLAQDTACDRLFLFVNSAQACRVLSELAFMHNELVTIVIPRDQELPSCIRDRKLVVHTWSGNQTRFSRIKYAFMQAVLQEIIRPESKVVCVLGPWGRDHLDTITVHDLSLSWSEEYPFDPRSLMANAYFQAITAIIDIALDIGALGREGKPVGTTFVVGDVEQIMRSSHQAIFNPFKGYPATVRNISSSEVVESIKELAKLDGAFVVSGSGVVEAAGRHLDAVTFVTRQVKGLGSRHRAAASITVNCDAVAVVVSESTGRVTVFSKGRIVAVLDPVISSRVV